MMSLTFGLFTQVSGSGPLGPLVKYGKKGQNLTYSLHQGHCQHQGSKLTVASSRFAT